MDGVAPFNPLDKKNLAASVANALVETEAVPLGALERFGGAGVYALYYSGGFYAYQPLACANSQEARVPIYVGMAESAGKRKGGFIEGSGKAAPLFRRLNDHAKSIGQASNLAIEDFTCRYLVVDDLWVALGESLLISRYAPVWNVLVDGFGNHDPGKGRAAGKRPRWDMLHPGREWAAALPEHDDSAERIGAEAYQYLAERVEVIVPSHSSFTFSDMGFD